VTGIGKETVEKSTKELIKERRRGTLSAFQATKSSCLIPATGGKEANSTKKNEGGDNVWGAADVRGIRTEASRREWLDGYLIV